MEKCKRTCDVWPGGRRQVDPINKFRDVVCDLAYGCVIVDQAFCSKSCCEQLLATPTSGDVIIGSYADSSDSSASTLLTSSSRTCSDVTVTSSCGGGGGGGGASDAGYVASDDSAEGKKLLLNRFDRTTSLDSSRKCASIISAGTES